MYPRVRFLDISPNELLLIKKELEVEMNQKPQEREFWTSLAGIVNFSFTFGSEQQVGHFWKV